MKEQMYIRQQCFSSPRICLSVHYGRTGQRLSFSSLSLAFSRVFSGVTICLYLINKTAMLYFTFRNLNSSSLIATACLDFSS